MSKVLFPDFLNHPGQYEEAERLWRERWDDLMCRSRPYEVWKSPWLETTYADGTPQRDGNPIFSAVCPRDRFGVRVIQTEPSGEGRELFFWTDTFAEGEPEEVRELVITCVLTDETLLDAVDLMHQWVTLGEVRLAQGGRACLLPGPGAFHEARPSQVVDYVTVPPPRRARFRELERVAC